MFGYSSLCVNHSLTVSVCMLYYQYPSYCAHHYVPKKKINSVPLSVSPMCWQFINDKVEIRQTYSIYC